MMYQNRAAIDHAALVIYRVDASDSMGKRLGSTTRGEAIVAALKIGVMDMVSYSLRQSRLLTR